MRRLLIRPGGIGDCILSFPALEHLKADYTEVWVRGDVAPLVRFADGVFSIASTGLDLLGLPGIDPSHPLIERLRFFDSIVSWYGGNRPEFRDHVDALRLPFRFLSALPPAGLRMHAADFFLEQAGGAGLAAPRIGCPPAERRDLAVMHPFSGSSRKNWPRDRYRELACRLPSEVQWCAGPEEALDNAVRMENLWDLACWLRSARVYIGNDSGITHLAAAVGTPVVAIFGPTDPELWAPRGEHVRIVAGTLDSIDVDQVWAAVQDLRGVIIE
ncbi:MAG TPA: glycosyltransferase family 9 protein [Bryobacteraceae bacterium]|nr:glycosyltransferase family 9 protein [Bryobacteraceae bacterium]